MERRPDGSVILDDVREAGAIFDLHLCLQYLSKRKTKQAGQLYDFVGKNTSLRTQEEYAPVELSKRQVKRLGKLVTYTIMNFDQVLSGATEIDIENSARAHFSRGSMKSPYLDQANQSLEAVYFLNRHLNSKE